MSCLYCGSEAKVYVPNPDGRFPYCTREHAIKHRDESFARGELWRQLITGDGTPVIFSMDKAEAA